MEKQKIELGDTVRQDISGFEGVVIGIGKHLHNMDTIGVKPTGLVDGAPAKSLFFDIPELVLVSKGNGPIVTAPECTVKLGDKVKDTLSPYTGVVIGTTVFDTGCYRVSVQSPDLSKGVPVDAGWFADTQLEVVTPNPVKEPVKRGGPMCRVERAMR